MPGRRSRGLAVGLGVAALLGALTACEPTGPASLLTRPTTPVVLTGSKLPSLVGTAPGRIVAFRHALSGGAGSWVQIPVQVDQRKVVAFGTAPGSNTTAGTTGTVYGSGSGGPTALQYADAGTWVGADTDATFDADDELVFMASDAGGTAQKDVQKVPAGVVAGSGVQVRVSDPRATSEHGWVYLFVSTGSLDPAAGKDYVDYDFALTSGAYKTTYKRADGPNPETSRVVTDRYEIGFSDRWKEDVWKVRSAGASGVDVLDGHKNQFAFSTCTRSNATFADAEGAFVANIDGPVRAIRSYVGANSGPKTQRTHLMYRDREVVITDLRVHAIPAILDFLDLSDAATGMAYRSSTKPGGVTVDGAPDSVSTALPSWEALDGSQGQVLVSSSFTSSEASVLAGRAQIYRDEADPADNPCWGDDHYMGASGLAINASIPNTDPSSSPTATLQGRRTFEFGSPASDPATIPTTAADWSADLATALTTTVTAFKPT